MEPGEWLKISLAPLSEDQAFGEDLLPRVVHIVSCGLEAGLVVGHPLCHLLLSTT